MLRRLIAVCTVSASPVLADYQLALTDIGKRDYYCTITVELTNQSDTILTEINAFFLNYVGDTQVGRSKGASFMNVAPGTVSSATFETPNAPCSARETQVESYQMVIGACRIDNAFEDKAVCIDAVRLTPPFHSVVPLN